MSVSHNKAKMFLEGLHGDNTKSTFEQLTGLVEMLENKVDPDPIEIRVCGRLEKYRHLESQAPSQTGHHLPIPHMGTGKDHSFLLFQKAPEMPDISLIVIN